MAALSFADAPGVTAISDEMARLRAEIADRDATIASLKALPVVPVADHRRACDARDRALQDVDALTRMLADAQDHRVARIAQEAVACLQSVMATLSHAAGSPSEIAAWRAAWAFLAEHAPPSEERRQMQEAYELWEARRK